MTAKEFKALQKEWYAKAADAGFNDIEDDHPWRLRGRTQSLEAVRDYLPSKQRSAHYGLDDLMDADNPAFNPCCSHKASYQEALEAVTLRAIKGNVLPTRTVMCWALRSQGHTITDIKDMLINAAGYRDLTLARTRALIQELEDAAVLYINEEFDA